MKKTLIIILNIFILAVVVLTPIFMWLSISAYRKDNPRTTAQTVLELWHVESFEGSSGLFSYLRNEAIRFNKSNKEIFIIVKKLTQQEFLETSKESKPDIISFSYHIGNDVLAMLTPLNQNFGVRPELQRAGEASGNIFAVPFAMSGYALISNKEVPNFETHNMLAGGNETRGRQVFASVVSPNDLPLISLRGRNDEVINNLSLKQHQNALSMFKTGQANNLIGKAKDVVNLTNTGQGTFSFKPTEGFSDMVQFMGVANNKALTQSQAFINHLTNTETQRRLVEINLFNVLGQSFHSASHMRKFEDALNKPIETLNVFIDDDQIETFRRNLELSVMEKSFYRQ
ncbi:MAG: hypothetical protein FWD89_01110 [Firmicutes bacterium]|nr:hypothetical protein [Bacillota bacterium]MCL2770892.1 hypothetical protein [Bacillota bacterium]